MPSAQYRYVRSRQLEGTYPGDRWTGAWITTDLRIQKGWGCPTEGDWPYETDLWPPIEPPGMDERAKENRLFAYVRVRTIDDCRRVVAGKAALPHCAFEIDGSWKNPNPLHGIIPSPVGRMPTGESHAVTLVRYDDRRRRFKFANTWGTRWGHHGYGSLPYDYFPTRLLEAWCSVLYRPLLVARRPPSRIVVGRSTIADPLGRVLRVVEIEDQEQDEMLGWAFLVETADGPEVEELFVRPAYRGLGYGRKLAARLAPFLPRRAWIPRVDWTGSLTPALAATLRRLNLAVQPSPERWAAAVAVRMP